MNPLRCMATTAYILSVDTGRRPSAQVLIALPAEAEGHNRSNLKGQMVSQMVQVMSRRMQVRYSMHFNKLPNPSPHCTPGDFGVGRVHSCPPIE